MIRIIFQYELMILQDYRIQRLILSNDLFLNEYDQKNEF